LKEKPVEALPEKQKIIEKAPPPEIKTPQIAPQQPAPKPKQTGCGVLFVPEKSVFVIEHSRWPTKATADSVAAQLAKNANLPATVQQSASATGRTSFSVLLGAFKSRKAAEEACAKLNDAK
jgi:cell division protein FtsN